MELVFLRQLEKMIEDVNLKAAELFLLEVGDDEEVIGCIENDDVKKLLAFRDKLKAETLDIVCEDAIATLKDINSSLEYLENPIEDSEEDLNRRNRVQGARKNRTSLQMHRYKIVEHLCSAAIIMQFPKVHDLETVYFREGWKITKKSKPKEIADEGKI